jgi:putative holliday junction resolvase
VPGFLRAVLPGLPAAGQRMPGKALVGRSSTTYKTPVTPQRPARSGLPGQQRTGRENVAQDAEAFCRGLPAGARLLGIDVGSKTLGLALSDVTRTIASGLLTLKRGKFSTDAAQLKALIEAHGVGGLVVGLPTDLHGRDGPSAQSTRAFARNLAHHIGLPVLLWDERFSTAAAERILIAADTSRRRRAAVIDKVAATLILQNALDRMRQACPGPR